MPGYKTKVVDPTGAGNAFMGGLMAALDEGKDMHEGESARRSLSS
jgi:sugar/nucleoside kinase (ribokinase family)